MPMAVPILLAAGTMAAGAAAVTAGSLVIGGMMLAGGFMTMAGTVTGDKNLAQYGGLLSLAGGVAGGMTGAWDTAASQVAAESAAGTEAGVSAAVPQDGGALSSGADLAAQPDALGAQLGSTPTIGQTPTTTLGQTAVAPGTVDVPSTVGFDTGYVQAGDSQFAGSFAPSNPGVVSPGVTGPQLASTGNEGMLQSVGGNIAQGFRNLGSYITDPKNARVVQIGAGLLQGGLNSYSQQEQIRERMRLEEEALARQRARYSQSLAGLKMPTYQGGTK